MAPKMTASDSTLGRRVRAATLTVALAALVLLPGGGALAAPHVGAPTAIAHRQDDDGESKIVPRGSSDEQPADAEGDVAAAGEDAPDADAPGEEAVSTDGPAGADETFVKLPGIGRPGANLEPSQWMGVFDGRLIEPFAVAPAPVRLTIGEIGIDAAITTREIVNGEMQTPVDEHEVTWYKETAHPGQKGNMVFAGHLNWYGVPEAVFYHIGELQKGDEITVTGADGEVYTYRVKWVKLVDIQDADLDKVVGSTKKPSLTLITCGGSWEADLGQYGHRTVVRAELETT